jgi:hypothetical protein
MKKLTFGLLALLLSTCGFAQFNGGGDDRVYFGGGFGLTLGNDVTSVSASPLVGYRVTDIFSVGAQLIYQYYGEDVELLNGDTERLTANNYGGGPFTRLEIGDRYFAHGEYEVLSFEYASRVFADRIELERGTNHSIWLGGGFRERGFFLMGLYNVLYDESDDTNPYASPFTVRAGFAFGF